MTIDKKDMIVSIDDNIVTYALDYLTSIAILPTEQYLSYSDWLSDIVVGVLSDNLEQGDDMECILSEFDYAVRNKSDADELESSLEGLSEVTFEIVIVGLLNSGVMDSLREGYDYMNISKLAETINKDMVSPIISMLYHHYYANGIKFSYTNKFIEYDTYLQDNIIIVSMYKEYGS